MDDKMNKNIKYQYIDDNINQSLEKIDKLVILDALQQRNVYIKEVGVGIQLNFDNIPNDCIDFIYNYIKLKIKFNNSELQELLL